MIEKNWFLCYHFQSKTSVEVVFLCIEADCCGLVRTALEIFVLRLIIGIVLPCGYVLHGSELVIDTPYKLNESGYKTLWKWL